MKRNYTLSIAKKVAELLQQDPIFETTMTHIDDTIIPLKGRAQMANDISADAFISIYANTYEQDPSISGTETYYYDEGSIALAEAIHQQLVQATGFKDRGVKREDWMVLKMNERPAILAEVGFLTNKDDEASMSVEEEKNQVAQAIVNGLKQYLMEQVW